MMGETIQYNVPVKILKPLKESIMEESLKPYNILTDKREMEDTRFSKEKFPYIGEIIVLKTLNKQHALTAHKILSGIEGLLVFPISECNWGDDFDGDQRYMTKSQNVGRPYVAEILARKK